MPTKLDKLLDDIDPSKTIDVVENRINMALSEYYRRKNTVESWEEYIECLADFVRQAGNAALNRSYP